MTLLDAALLQIKSYNKIRDSVLVVVEKYNINIAQWRMLSFVDKHRITTPTMLAKELAVGKSYIVEAMAQLVEMDMIRIESNPRDKRSKIINLTNDSIEILIGISHQLRETLAKLMKNVTEEELIAYLSVLSKIVQN